jgi:hypothetical protein
VVVLTKFAHYYSNKYIESSLINNQQEQGIKIFIGALLRNSEQAFKELINMSEEKILEKVITFKKKKYLNYSSTYERRLFDTIFKTS